MSRCMIALALCLSLLAAGLAGAAEYRAFTLADSGQPVVLNNVFMLDETTGYAQLWAPELAGVTIFQTQNGGLTWAPISTLETPLSPAANGSSVVLRPHVFLVRVSYWDQATRAMAGRLWASWDQGLSWNELSGSIASAMETQEVGIWHPQASQDGIWLRATGSYAEGLRSYMLHSQDQGATWSRYGVSLSQFSYAVTQNNGLTGYGYNSQGEQVKAYFDQQAGFMALVTSDDLARTEAAMLKCNWGGNVFTLIDYQTGNRTPQRMALFSLDGGANWTRLFDSDLNAADHPGQDFFCAQALNAQNAYGAWHQWQTDAQGNSVNTGYAIKRTSDGGASWTTLAAEASPDYWYEVMVTLDGRPWVARSLPGGYLYEGGFFNLNP